MEDREAFRTAFVYSTGYATVDDTSCTTATYTIRTIKTHLRTIRTVSVGVCTFLVHIDRKIRFLSVLRGEVSTKRTAVKMDNHTHTDRHFRGLRGNILA